MTAEELLKAQEERRLVVLPYGVGSTIYHTDYLIGDNYLSVIEHRVSSLKDAMLIALSDQKYFLTYEAAKQWIDSGF